MCAPRVCACEGIKAKRQTSGKRGREEKTDRERCQRQRDTKTENYERMRWGKGRSRIR